MTTQRHLTLDDNNAPVEMDECEEAFNALLFWQSLAEGHHLGFQQFIGSRVQVTICFLQSFSGVTCKTRHYSK